MEDLFKKIYKNRKVFITGHTGFKGSWLTFWLQHIGAEVFGFSLGPPTIKNHFELLDLDIQQITADIRDADALYGSIKDFQPDIVFHLAAQPLVRNSYQYPVETFETNVMGTLNVFEACRKTGSVMAILNITSDKCYENQERSEGYREGEPMGGSDPYSCSKACSELLTASYRSSYFNIKDYGKGHSTLLASCRSGNVIGGGDWAIDRLIPDLIRAVEKGEKVLLRNPASTRPWQHVLECLSGYLLLGQLLLEGKLEFAQGWNFGPREGEISTVEDVIKKMSAVWSKVGYDVDTKKHLHEAKLLQLNCDKAEHYMQWHEVWSMDETVTKTVAWYRAYYDNNKVLTNQDLKDYIEEATKKGLTWTQ